MKKLKTYDEFVNESVNEGILATAGAITLGLLGLGLIKGTAKYALNSLSRQIESNKNAKEAKQVMEWMDKKYGDLFNNDNKLKSLIKTFVKFDEKTRLELEQIKKGGAPDETYSIIETPSFDARNKSLFAIDDYIKEKITGWYGPEEVKKLNNIITNKLSTYRNELINVLNKITESVNEAKKSTQMKQFDKKVDAKLIANRMRNNKSKSAKSFQLNVFADKVSKMGKVSERDINNLLPDYIPGGLIASLFTD